MLVDENTILHMKLLSFMSGYAQLLDSQQFDQWVELFNEEAIYIVTTKYEQFLGRDLSVIRCSNKNMIKDRINGLIKAVFFRERNQRRIVGPLNLTVNDTEIYGCTSFALYESYSDNESKLIATGEYQTTFKRDIDRISIMKKICVIDSQVFPDSLIYPV